MGLFGIKWLPTGQNWSKWAENQGNGPKSTLNQWANFQPQPASLDPLPALTEFVSLHPFCLLENGTHL